MIKRAAEGKKVRMKTLIKSDMAANIFQSSDVGTHNRRTRGADWDSPGPARYLHTHTQDIYIYIYERSSSSTRPYLCGARTRGKCGRCAQDRRRGIGADYSRVRRSKDSIHNRCRRFYTEEGGYPSRVIDRDRTNVTYIHSTQAIIICRISSANRLVTADVYKRPAARPLAQQSPIVTLRPSRFTASRYSPRSISCPPFHRSVIHPMPLRIYCDGIKRKKLFVQQGGVCANREHSITGPMSTSSKVYPVVDKFVRAKTLPALFADANVTSSPHHPFFVCGGLLLSI